jgi:flagellar protein FlgJ
MTPISAPSLPNTASALPADATARDKLSGVAKQFEGIFVRQMLAAARKTNFAGEDSLFSSQAMDTFNQMQDERFADIAADTGAFGMAKMIEAHLAQFVSAATAPASTATGTATGTGTETGKNQEAANDGV